MSRNVQKLKEVQSAISRVKLLLEEHEDNFIAAAGIKEMTAKKKAKGYYDYMIEDGAKYNKLSEIESRLKSYVKQEEDEAKKVAKQIQV